MKEEVYNAIDEKLDEILDKNLIGVLHVDIYVRKGKIIMAKRSFEVDLPTKEFL